MKQNFLVSLLYAALLLAAPLAARPSRYAGPPPQAAKLMSQRTLDLNAWTIHSCNYGPFVNPGPGAGGFWGGPGYNYIYGAGLVFGAKDSSGHRRFDRGYDCASGQSEFGPVNPYTEDWANWLTDPLARLYLSTDPVDLGAWPLRDSADNPIVRSLQDSYCKYSDQNPQYCTIIIDTLTGDTLAGPIGIVIEQISYAWNYADNNDIVFFILKVKNKNNYTLDSCYAGPAIDCDIGTEAEPIANDRTAFDYTRNLGIQFQTEPEPGWPRTGVVGFRFFQGPVNNNGYAVSVVDNQFPHDIPPGQMLGLTAFTVFAITIDAESDEEWYMAMMGVDWQTMIMDAYDEWGATFPSDKRFCMASGPFRLGPDSITTFCVGAIAAWDTAALKLASDVAQTIYDNGFELAQPPAPPLLCAVPGDGKVYLSWNKAAETTPDPYFTGMDSLPEWHSYFEGSWLYCVDLALVDSLEIKTGATTTVRIARGSPNPPGGTDTVSTRYSHKALYRPYDFQAYALYRAANPAGLGDPDQRTQLGTLHIGSSGARTRNWDRDDGVQIVRDFQTWTYHTPDTTYILPIYDTLGADCGLAYGFVDQGLTNGLAYWYGLSAIDYQPNSYFTHKSPTTMASSPLDNAVMAVPRADPPGSQPAGILIRVDVGDTVATDYWYNTRVVNPEIVPSDSFKLVWQPMTVRVSTFNRLPVYHGYLYNMAKQLVDSLVLLPEYGLYGSSTHNLFYGPSQDELPFGGIGFQPFLLFDPWADSTCVLDSVVILEASGGARTYPADSVTLGWNASVYTITSCMWQWRGSDFEIRWKDTVNASAQPALTAQVWDITNDVEVPLEVGVAKNAMIKSSWCFNYTPATSVALVDSNSVNSIGAHICGFVLFFNRAGMVTRRMDWHNRPETGDVWRVYTSGPRPPVQGNRATFILSPAVVGVAGGPGTLAPDLMLNQNLPNPFRQLTTINYQITKPGLVSLRVYNVAGQLVRTIVNSQQTAGIHNASWDGRDGIGRRVAAGVYLYQLRVGDKALTRKLVLVR